MMILASMNFFAIPANLAIQIREDYTEYSNRNYYGGINGRDHPNETSFWTYFVPSVSFKSPIIFTTDFLVAFFDFNTRLPYRSSIVCQASKANPN